METIELQILIDNSPLRLMVKQEIHHPDLWYAKLLSHADIAGDSKADLNERRESILMIALALLDYSSETKYLFNKTQQKVIEHIKDRLNADPIVPEDCYFD